MAATSYEKRQVFRQQHVLIENNLAPCQKPALAVAPERILAPADQDVGLGLDAVAIDQEAAGDRDFLRIGKRRLDALQLHVRHEMRHARARLFGPMDAGLDLLHPPAERLLALVEPVDVVLRAGELALVLAELHVAPHRHPIADVVGEQVEPVAIAALVEQLRLAIKKIRDLLAKQQPVDAGVALSHHLASRLRSSAPAMRSSTRATTGKPSCPQPCAWACL